MVNMVMTRKSASVSVVLKVELESFWEADELKEVLGAAVATEVVVMPGWKTTILKKTLKTKWIVLGVRHQVMHYMAAQRLTSSRCTRKKKTSIDAKN